jgi:hypothetical protein
MAYRKPAIRCFLIRKFTIKLMDTGFLSIDGNVFGMRFRVLH